MNSPETWQEYIYFFSIVKTFFNFFFEKVFC